MSEIQTVNQDGIVILNLKGRVDATNSGQVHDKVMDEIKKGCDKMIINFSGCQLHLQCRFASTDFCYKEFCQELRIICRLLIEWKYHEDI